MADALAAGYRHFDSARAYDNEAALGRALNKWIGGDKAKRRELFVVTKLPPGGLYYGDILLYNYRTPHIYTR